uniref:3CxxC-type domain-containing protein n=1 Tax=Panagrolaimus sp. JU765 TaxID=591449 RepID=A0AC34QL19_9BILA
MFEYDRLALDVAEQFTNKNYLNQNNSNCYDSISKFQQIRSKDDVTRRLSGGSTSNDVFDCGASSGYGSPGLIGTPLASPSPNVQQIAAQLHKMFIDQGFCDDSTNSMPVPISSSLGSSISGHSPRSYELLAFSNSMKELKPSSLGRPNKFTPSPISPPHSIDLPSIEQPVIEKHAKPSTMPPIPLQTDQPTNRSNQKGVTPVAVEDGFSTDEIAQFAELLCSPKKAPPVRYQCHICYNTGHYISDCPMRFNTPYEELTPYQGRKKCYGEFQCQQCKRKWTSQNSVANEAQSCIKCHVSVFPHKQLPIDKAVALGLVKAQKNVQAKIAPIGHGRPFTLGN